MQGRHSRIRVPTFWKVLKCPGNEKNVLESWKMFWKVLEINEFSGNLGLIEIWNDYYLMITVVPFLWKFEIPSTFLGKNFLEIYSKNDLESPGNDSRHLSGNPCRIHKEHIPSFVCSSAIRGRPKRLTERPSSKSIIQFPSCKSNLVLKKKISIISDAKSENCLTRGSAWP